MGYIIVCSVPDRVAERQLEVVARVRARPRKGEHTDAVTGATVELAEALLDFFFMRPLEIIGVGHMTRRMARMGVKSGLGIISQVGRRVFGQMNEAQLLAYADFVESMLERRQG